jgi:hypothetical protein
VDVISILQYIAGDSIQASIIHSLFLYSRVMPREFNVYDSFELRDIPCGLQPSSFGCIRQMSNQNVWWGRKRNRGGIENSSVSDVLIIYSTETTTTKI